MKIKNKKHLNSEICKLISCFYDDYIEYKGNCCYPRNNSAMRKDINILSDKMERLLDYLELDVVHFPKTTKLVKRKNKTSRR